MDCLLREIHCDAKYHFGRGFFIFIFKAQNLKAASHTGKSQTLSLTCMASPSYSAKLAIDRPYQAFILNDFA